MAADPRCRRGPGYGPLHSDSEFAWSRAPCPPRAQVYRRPVFTHSPAASSTSVWERSQPAAPYRVSDHPLHTIAGGSNLQPPEAWETRSLTSLGALPKSTRTVPEATEARIRSAPLQTGPTSTRSSTSTTSAMPQRNGSPWTSVPSLTAPSWLRAAGASRRLRLPATGLRDRRVGFQP